MNPFVAAFCVLGFIALIGLAIILLDEGLKWPR